MMLINAKLNIWHSSSKPLSFCCLFFEGTYEVSQRLVSGQLQQVFARLLRLPCFFLTCREAAIRWQPITSVEFKLVARQVEAPVVIRATKLKFVAESRTRVYFSQHVASPCNTVLYCETSWSQSGNTMCLNLQRNNVARQVEEKCFPYYRTLMTLIKACKSCLSPLL